MPRRPPVPVVQVAAGRRAHGESLRQRRKHTFDGQTLNNHPKKNPMIITRHRRAESCRAKNVAPPLLSVKGHATFGLRVTLPSG